MGSSLKECASCGFTSNKRKHQSCPGCGGRMVMASQATLREKLSSGKIDQREKVAPKIISWRV